MNALLLFVYLRRSGAYSPGAGWWRFLARRCLGLFFGASDAQRRRRQLRLGLYGWRLFLDLFALLFFLDLLRLHYFPLIGLAIVAGGVLAGQGIANERKWGYGLGIVMAFLPFVLRVYYAGIGNVLTTDALTLLFEIALVALLLHPQSRDYQRIWFK